MEETVSPYLVEFYRFGHPEKELKKDEPYILARESLPLDSEPRRLTIDHAEYWQRVGALQYSNNNPQAREEALAVLGREAKQLLDATIPDVLARSEEGPVQVDLVLNSAELSALPFEVATDDTGDFIFAREYPTVVLTRRIRQPRTEFQYPSRSRPRVLFAYSSAAAAIDPAPHQRALESALRAWSEPLEGQETESPDSAMTLTVLEDLSLEKLANACQTSVDEGNPFTHVHIFAHGSYPEQSKAKTGQFGLGIHPVEEGSFYRATAKEVSEAMTSLLGSCEALTLAACNAAHVRVTTSPERSVAHELHIAGFPVVLASQLPLTVAGSAVMTEEFYSNLLAGQDVRLAIHRTRLRLKKMHWNQVGHDWASIVGYVSLPHDYQSRLYVSRLRQQLAALRTARRWTTLTLEKRETTPSTELLSNYDWVRKQLEARISNLRGFLPTEPNSSKTRTLPEGVFEETCGLLGSSEKSLAELLFARQELLSIEAHDGPSGEVRRAMERAQQWYSTGFHENISNHWTGVQSLALRAVLDGTIDMEVWTPCLLAAKLDTQRSTEKSIWAWGSIAELYLLAPFAGTSEEVAGKEALNAIQRLKEAVSTLYPKECLYEEATLRQFSHYTTWWHRAGDLLPGSYSPSPLAARLIEELESTKAP